MGVTIEQALVQFLQADAAIVALLGAPPNTRISPWSGQGEQVPRVTYKLLSSVDDYDLAGSVDEPQSRIQLDCWAATKTLARVLAYTLKNSRGDGTGELVRGNPARLKEYRGTMASGVAIGCTLLENELDEDLAPWDASGRPTEPRVTFDLVFCWKEV